MRTMQRTTLLTALLATTIFGFLSAPVYAQVTPDHPVVERYNRTAKGANSEEWQRRLGDDEVKIRLDAVESLGDADDETSVRPLLEAMADPDERVVIKAIDYLGAIGSPESAEALIQLLFLSGVRKPVKMRALTALGRIGSGSTTTRLIDYASTVPDMDLSCRAIYALGEIADPGSRERLQELRDKNRNPETNRLCDDALSKIDTRIASAPGRQPTLLELEKRLRPPDQQ